MVRALLDGRKTVTRRLVKPQPSIGDSGCWFPAPPRQPAHSARHYANEAHLRKGLAIDFCPYGAAGDTLWVRETWSPDHRDVYPCYDFVYRADGTVSDRDVAEHVHGCTEKDRDAGVRHFECLACIPFRWRPSTHMPRRASRLTLEVVSVRVERLQDVSQDDARREGVVDTSGAWEGLTDQHLAGPRGAFRALWESSNGAGSWDANPWVWRVEFRKAVTP
jgi:hypothetical protein